MIHTCTLSNGVQMPILHQGLPLIGELASIKKTQIFDILRDTFELNIFGLDTSHEYGMSEKWIGEYLNHELKNNNIERNRVFITTKIGNYQQAEGHIEAYVDESLKALKLDQIDLMLLHWPFPGYVRNWEKLINVYEKGKVRSIGIANAQVRHLEILSKEGLLPPHVVQTEIHPLNSCTPLLQYCSDNNIQLQACSSLCVMWPIIRDNICLQNIAKKNHKTLSQVILRWHIQRGVSPIFRSFNINHLRPMSQVFDFKLSEEDMRDIETQNINYRVNPESVNCPGY